VDESPGDRHALLHAAREFPGVAVFEAVQTDQAEEVEGGPAVALAPEALHVDRQQHVIENAAPGKEHRRLEGHADVASGAGDGGAAQRRLAAGGGKDAGQDLEQCGLSTAGWAHHRHELTLVDGEADFGQRGDALTTGGVVLGETANGDRTGRHEAECAVERREPKRDRPRTFIC